MELEKTAPLKYETDPEIDHPQAWKKHHIERQNQGEYTTNRIINMK